MSVPVRLRARRVLVTGASGLIGSALVRRLVDVGAMVHVLTIPADDPRSELRRSGLIREVTAHTAVLEDAEAISDLIKSIEPEFVFHLGAQTIVGEARSAPARTFKVNVAGTWHVLEACRQIKTPPVAIVVASSDKAYGRSDHLPYVEADALAGEEPYEASKAMADILAKTYGRAYGLPTRITRCGNVYGPGDLNWSRIVPGTIRSYLRREPPVIRSDGSPIRDYVHVDDVAAGYVLMATADLSPGEAFNLSSGERLRVREVVEMIRRQMGSDLEPVVQHAAVGELDEQYLDSSKARATLGWRAERRLEEALPELVMWYADLLREDIVERGNIAT